MCRRGRRLHVFCICGRYPVSILLSPVMSLLRKADGRLTEKRVKLVVATKKHISRSSCFLRKELQGIVMGTVGRLCCRLKAACENQPGAGTDLQTARRKAKRLTLWELRVLWTNPHLLLFGQTKFATFRATTYIASFCLTLRASMVDPHTEAHIMHHYDPLQRLPCTVFYCTRSLFVRCLYWLVFSLK